MTYKEYLYQLPEASLSMLGTDPESEIVRMNLAASLQTSYSTNQVGYVSDLMSLSASYELVEKSLNMLGKEFTAKLRGKVGSFACYIHDMKFSWNTTTA